MAMKHLFKLGETVGAYAEVLRVKEAREVAGVSTRQFTLVMRDGTQVLSAPYPADEYPRMLQEFLTAWEAALDSHSAPARPAVTLQVKKLRPDARTPVRAFDGSSCFDLHAVDGGSIAPGARALVKTGLQMAVPRGFEIQVRSRSGHAAKTGVFVLNSPGTVDSDYRGEVGVILQNSGTAAFTYAAGDRIAQIAVCAVEMCQALEVETLSDTQRGAGGFGSTGV